MPVFNRQRRFRGRVRSLRAEDRPRFGPAAGTRRNSHPAPERAGSDSTRPGFSRPVRCLRRRFDACRLSPPASPGSSRGLCARCASVGRIRARLRVVLVNKPSPAMIRLDDYKSTDYKYHFANQRHRVCCRELYGNLQEKQTLAGSKYLHGSIIMGAKWQAKRTLPENSATLAVQNIRCAQGTGRQVPCARDQDTFRTGIHNGGRSQRFLENANSADDHAETRLRV